MHAAGRNRRIAGLGNATGNADEAGETHDFSPIGPRHD
jgi:hypothetical protein